MEPELEERLERALALYPEAGPRLEPVSPEEVYRRFLRLVEWRLEQTAEVQGLDSAPRGAYRSKAELSEDLQAVRASLERQKGRRIVSGELADWICRVEIFGLRYAALAKADMPVAARYASLVEPEELRDRVWGLISAEYERSREAVLRATGQATLLADVPWLEHSIDVRNPNVDPLNLIQIEALRRRRSRRRQRESGQPGAAAMRQPPIGPEAESSTDAREDGLHDLLRLTIEGLSSGLRTTG